MDILNIYQRRLRVKNYSERTIETYSYYLKQFIINSDIKDPYQLTTGQMIKYLQEYNYTSISQQNQIINGLKQLYKRILNRSDIHLSKIERPRKEKKLPQVIDQDLLKQKIKAIPNIKHRAILCLGFSCGLRVSEVVNLKIKDIDSKMMLIHINNAKGRKDRIVKLSEYTLQLLREYYKEYHPVDYLFNGQFDLQYSTSSCEAIFKKYIDANLSYHKLRHSYASALVENGVNLKTIQDLLGHQSSKTTEIYCHTTLKHLNQAQLPM